MHTKWLQKDSNSNRHKTIGKDCFTGTDVEEVILPEGIERIEPCAFANCTELKKINFPETLNVIKDRVFLNCHLLTEVILPETLAELGNYAFYDTALKNWSCQKERLSRSQHIQFH